jgi:hypothetical protein
MIRRGSLTVPFGHLLAGQADRPPQPAACSAAGRPSRPPLQTRTGGARAAAAARTAVEREPGRARAQRQQEHAHGLALLELPDGLPRRLRPRARTVMLMLMPTSIRPCARCVRATAGVRHSRQAHAAPEPPASPGTVQAAAAARGGAPAEPVTQQRRRRSPRPRQGRRAARGRGARAWPPPPARVTWRSGGCCTSSALPTMRSASSHCENTCARAAAALGARALPERALP